MPPPASAEPEPVSRGRLGRWLLGAIVAGYVALAVNASVLMPLWEISDEHTQLQAAMHWAREGSMPERSTLPRRELFPRLQEPLACWVYALGSTSISDVPARVATSSVDWISPRADRKR